MSFFAEVEYAIDYERSEKSDTAEHAYGAYC